MKVTLPASNDCPVLSQLIEKVGVNVHYECKHGVCGACRCKITAGFVFYEQPPLAYLRKDEILPCIAKTTSAITLEI
ncbi:2Fe-2S iron-sulfur cluster-binding protein [Motilimonas pumila]|uniref:2Fe-2S ferredoxin-type domain-containing protein n=1 Tax=Motilimonas pumila TaxID=2303987 RepID=A0A418YA17_9GAMM|nr:2Fe-2S iron-sulfur cluster-binding protein [Motilimonas pumila]RJG38773.1 hypothetical protein D1Z90_18690 [Motilimonas pumila]